MRSGHAFLPFVLLSMILLSLPFVIKSEQNVYFLSLVMIWTIFALGFDFAFGVAGLLSFGHAAFFGLGGYIIAWLTLSLDVPFFAALAISGVGGGLLALVFAAISLRATGIIFAVFTLILAQLLYVLFSVKLGRLTGGVDGLPGVPRPYLLGIDFISNWNFAILTSAIAMILLWVSVLLRASPFGQVLSAVRQNRARASQIGYDVNRYSAAAFIISGVYSGIAGGLNASLISFVGPDALHWSISGEIVMATLIGGINSSVGPVIGAFILQGLNTTLSKNSFYLQALLGMLFILFSIFFPKGVWGLFRTGGTRWLTKMTPSPTGPDIGPKAIGESETTPKAKIPGLTDTR